MIHIAGLMREKIEHHETIIDNLKSRRSDWSGHATRVNCELRPLLVRINQELIDSVSHRRWTRHASHSRCSSSVAPASQA
ncbi:MAG: hypothetical protein R3C56_15795 [Pirellulaceae bacterium]